MFNNIELLEFFGQWRFVSLCSSKFETKCHNKMHTSFPVRQNMPVCVHNYSILSGVDRVSHSLWLRTFVWAIFHIISLEHSIYSTSLRQQNNKITHNIRAIQAKSTSRTYRPTVNQEKVYIYLYKFASQTQWSTRTIKWPERQKNMLQI